MNKQEFASQHLEGHRTPDPVETGVDASLI